MSRRHAAEKKEVLSDPRFGDRTVTKFTNYLMYDGKKSIAEKIVYGALDVLSKKSNKSHIDAFHEALDNVKPSLEVRSRRIGGATYQIPVEVRASRKLALAMGWIITMARKRNESTMVERLSAELLDALNNKGASVKRKDDMHKMAEANKAFAHYRW